MSRLTGHDTKTCGKVSFPCRTISYGIQLLSTDRSYIFLDGTGTLDNPYTCEALDPGQPGIYLNKSVSFVGIKSRARISCLHGNSWLVNGTTFRDGLQTTFFGLAFLNTSVRLFDASVGVEDTVFADSKLVSLDIQVVYLPRFDLSLNNVVFENNAACIRINFNVSKVFVNITNAVFYQNGNSSFGTSSILGLSCKSNKNNLIKIQLKNCSFEENMFIKTYGMVSVLNALGSTNISINQLRLEENSPLNPRSHELHTAFNLVCARVVMSLDSAHIFKMSANFFTSTGGSAEVNISNIVVDGFHSARSAGGFVNLFQDSAFISIKDSSFRNGNNQGVAGVLYVAALHSTLTIQNSTFHNISSRHYGGAVYLVFDNSQYLKLLNRSKSFFVVRIINSSFSNCSSKRGGAVCVFGEKLLAVMRDNSFLRNSATFDGGALIFLMRDDASVSLHNNYFLKNSAGAGAIVRAASLSRSSTFNISITKATFVGNKVYGWRPHSNAIVSLLLLTNTNIKDANFTNNIVKNGSCMRIFPYEKELQTVMFDNCMFRTNIGREIVHVQGQGLVTCKHCIFDSNFASWYVLQLGLHNSLIFIMNTTFVDNLRQAMYAQVAGVSMLSITDSVFIRNKNFVGSGGALTIGTYKNQPNNRFNARITRVLFQENWGQVGGVLSAADVNVVFTNCTFLNNLAIFQGGLIVSIVSGSVNLSLFNSVFRQTIPKVEPPGTKTLVATSFLRLMNQLIIVNTTFDQQTTLDDPLIFVPSAKNVSIDNASVSYCPLGHDIERTSYEYHGGYNRLISGFILSCKACDYNFYSLQRGSARGETIENGVQCLPCPRGADCVPTISSKTNYWGYYVSLNPPKLAFTICPFGYCKSPPTKSTEYNACQGKRTGVMCGMCSQGYTEALWSTYCTPVKDCNDYWFWILFLVLVFSMAIIFVFKPPFVTFCLKQIFWFRKSCPTPTVCTCFANTNEQSPQGELNQDKKEFNQLEDIIFYFYQIAQLLLFSTSLAGFFYAKILTPVLGFFNFQPILRNGDSLCPISGLTPEKKLVFKVAPVFGTMAAIFLIYGLNYLICHIKSYTRPAIAPYFQASIKTVFLGYVTMATVSISLIRCVFVADESRWFYDGNITCYQWWQYASITFISIFVIPFIFVLAVISFKLHNDEITVREFLLAIIFPLPFLMLWLLRFACSSTVANVEETHNVNALKEIFLAPYRQPDDASKRGAIYWQSVLIARRFILVLIFCFVTEPSIRLFCMTIVCVVVLCCHLKVKPFQNSLANNCESLSLLCLIIVSLMNQMKSMFFYFELDVYSSLGTALKVVNWVEIIILGIFPTALVFLLSFAIISVPVRALVVGCKLTYNFSIRARTSISNSFSRARTSISNSFRRARTSISNSFSRARTSISNFFMRSRTSIAHFFSTARRRWTLRRFTVRENNENVVQNQELMRIEIN